MKQGELNHAAMDFTQRMNDIEGASSSADILATPIISGIITIKEK